MKYNVADSTAIAMTMPPGRYGVRHIDRWSVLVYVIVNNGYLQWSCTVPPFTITSDMDEIRWSKWLESMWKDVECTFGILKGRWRILKSSRS
jgi:hypothetical protein